MTKLGLSYFTGKLGLSESVEKIASNSAWLVLDKVCRLGGGLLVSIMLARYLGPEKFGVLSYALSITAFLGAFVYLGLSGLVVRDLVRHPGQKEILLGTTFALKMGGGVLAYSLILVLAFLVHDHHGFEFQVLVIMGLSLFFKPFDTIDFWFQSRVRSRFTVMARVGAFILSACLKAALVLAGASLIVIAWAFALEFILAALFLILMYRYQGLSILAWKIRLNKVRELLGQSWMLLASGFLGLIYLKADQIMLRWMIGPEEVGIYSVAAVISEAWYFIPGIIALSCYPRLIELKKAGPGDYENAVQKLLDLLFAMSVCVALAITFSAHYLIDFLYGPDYQKASTVLMIHIWAGVFMFMREVFNKWVLIENLLVFTIVSHGLGALANVILNLLLIPVYQSNGAAVATLISYAFAAYFFLFLRPATMGLGMMMTRSFLLPLRFIARIGRRRDH